MTPRAVSADVRRGLWLGNVVAFFAPVLLVWIVSGVVVAANVEWTRTS